MRYSLGLLAVASVFLCTYPVETAIADGLAVTSEEVKIGHTEALEQRIEELLRLSKLGMQQSNKGNWKEALNNFEQALVIVREIGNRKIESLIINDIGRIYIRLAEYPKALNYFQQSLVISKQIGDKATEGETLNNIAVIYTRLGEYPKALDYNQQSLAIKKQIGDKALIRSTLNNIAVIYTRLGEYPKALDYNQQSLAIEKQIGDKAGVGNTLNNIGNVYEGLGEYPKALDYYQESLAISRQVGDKADVGNTFHNIANIYQSLGKYALSLDYYQQSLAIRKQIADKAGISSTLNSIGSVYGELGEYPKALDYYQQSLDIDRQLGNKADNFRTLGNIGTVYYNLKKYSLSLDYYQQSFAMIKKIGDKAAEGNIINNIGGVYVILGEYAKALDYYQQSLAIKKQIGDKAGKSGSLTNIGGLYYILRKYSKSLDYYQQSLAIVKQTGQKSIEGANLHNIGVLYNKIGKYPEAEKTLFATIEILENLRQELTDNQKISIFDTQASTYRFLQKTLIAQNKTTTALEISERSKARALVELLSSKLNPNKQINIKPPQIEQIKQIAQKQKATFVEYSIIDESQLYIWVIKPTGEVTFKQVDIKSLDIPLEKLVKNSRVSIGARGRAGIRIVQNTNPVNQKQNLQKLHKLLIEPIASHLPTNPEERVIFIPHESLFLVPFPALMDESGKYLIEKHTIMTAPAIQVLELKNKNNQGKLNLSSLQPKDLLVVGNPTMPVVGMPPTQLSKLPGAEKEAIAIAKLFNTTPLIGNQATKSAVVQKISSARVIHLATHGLLDGKDFGELTPGAIALAPNTPFTKGGKRGVVNEGLLKSTEIMDMKLNADLVVLSACDTGRGEIKGDGVIGLSRSLITAGASSVIVSLWKIPDHSTSDLMSEFYRQWEKTGDKAAALRTAMLKTMKTHGEPIHWAAFTLIGEAQ